MTGETLDKETGLPLVNVVEFLITQMRNYDSSPALVDANTGETYTYSDVIDRCQRLAAGLRELGFVMGDTMGILMDNNIEYPIVYLATLLLGGTLQPLSPVSTDAELLRRFKESSTKFLITSRDLGLRVLKIINDFKLQDLFTNIIVTGRDSSEFISYQGLIGTNRVTMAAKVNPQTAVAILLSSSGTTGLPKTVQWSHFGVMADFVQTTTMYQHPKGSVCLQILPMYHHFGAVAITFGGLFTGVQLVVMSRFNFDLFLQYIEQYKAEVLQIVPPIAVRLVKSSESSSRDLSSVKAINCGAAPLSRQVEDQLLQKFKLAFVGVGYGSTEAGCLSGNTRTAFKVGTCGRPTMYTTYKIIDPDTGAAQGPNQAGEITVKGPQITLGYLHNPEATKAVIDEQGYFHTGDRGFIDEDGFVHVVDRLKELIKYKAFQVAPAELENILLKHPEVSDAAVIGIPDLEAGELPKAFIVKKSSSNVTADEICKYVEKHVSPHMRLRGGAEFLAEIPKSPSGKILRRTLRSRTVSSILEDMQDTSLCFGEK